MVRKELSALGNHLTPLRLWRLDASTEEDRHAVVVYLRHLKPVRHRTPEPVRGNALDVPGAMEEDFGFKEYGQGIVTTLLCEENLIAIQILPHLMCDQNDTARGPALPARGMSSFNS